MKRGIKYYVALAQFSIAACCLLGTLLLGYVLPFPTDLALYALQCAYISTGINYIIFGLSPYYFNSRYPYVRYYVRIFCLVVMWFRVLEITVISLYTGWQYTGKHIYGIFETDVFSVLDYLILISCIYIGLVIAILNGIMNIYLTSLVISKRSEFKEHK